MILLYTKCQLRYTVFCKEYRTNSCYFPSGHSNLIKMSLKCKLVLVGVIYLSCKVVSTGCEVVWVNRNVRDSFLVGKDGCMYDSNVCTNFDARCTTPAGVCLCGSKPNYRNPRPGDDKGYGCLDNHSMRTAGIGEC
jgi:hypothetical protein